MLLSKRVGNPATLAQTAFIHDQMATACRKTRQAVRRFRKGRAIKSGRIPD
jgi:hypothetical protein